MASELVVRWTCDLCASIQSRAIEPGTVPSPRYTPPDKWVVIDHAEEGQKSHHLAVCAKCIALIRKAAPVFCPRCVQILKAEAASAQAEADSNVA